MADTVEIDLVPKITASTLDELKKTFSSAMQSPAGSAVSGVASGIGAVGAAISGGATAAFDGALSFIKQIEGFVKVANPAVVEQLHQAMNDVVGVIGQALTPIVKAIIPLVRLFGDALAALRPVMDLLVSAVTWAIDKITAALRFITFGLIQAGASTGSAAVGATTAGIGDAMKQMQLGAFGMGEDKKLTVAEEQLKELKEINGNTKKSIKDVPRSPVKPGFSGNNPHADPFFPMPSI